MNKIKLSYLLLIVIVFFTNCNKQEGDFSVEPKIDQDKAEINTIMDQQEALYQSGQESSNKAKGFTSYPVFERPFSETVRFQTNYSRILQASEKFVHHTYCVFLYNSGTIIKNINIKYSNSYFSQTYNRTLQPGESV